MATAVHDGGSTIAAQLAHAGLQAATPLTKKEAIGPSSLLRDDGAYCKEMTLAEIQQTVDAFVAAAFRAKDAGFDGVQIHAAHGYLLSQFLSPHSNRRQDEFGGSTDNRARIILDILGRIKSTLGEEFSVLIKMNSEDFIDGGLTVDDSLRVARLLEERHVQLSGICGDLQRIGSQRNYLH
jgi:2,4-dienoyl-CoA reductase-like NADH-dependent reductase (Old Yellow Enzyme family)